MEESLVEEKVEEPLKILSLRLLPNGVVRTYNAQRISREEQIHLLQEALKYLTTN
jgi:hypothetical protein